MEERSLDALVAEIEEFEARIKPLASFREPETSKPEANPLASFQTTSLKSLRPSRIPLERFALIFEGSAWDLEGAVRIAFDEYELYLHHAGRRLDLYFDYSRGRTGLALGDSFTYSTKGDDLRATIDKLFDENLRSPKNVFREELFRGELYALLESLRQLLSSEG